MKLSQISKRYIKMSVAFYLYQADCQYDQLLPKIIKNKIVEIPRNPKILKSQNS